MSIDESIPTSTKTCPDCMQTKSKTEFGRHPSYRDGLRNQCRDCRREYERRRSRSPENIEATRESRRRSVMKWRYGTTQDEVEKMVAAQNNRCLICNTEGEGQGMQRLCIDHDHNTGKIRGMLCRKCNAGLGYFRDNPTLIRTAASYLESR